MAVGQGRAGGGLLLNRVAGRGGGDLGLVNAVVRPIMVILTLPLTLVTLGLFLLVVNAAMIGLTAWFLGGFAVNGLWAGIGAAIVTGVVSWIAALLFGEGERAR